MPSGIFTLKQQDLALTQGAWTNQPPNSVNYLVVAGGGAGAYQGAGGAGGLLQGSIGITSGTSYTVTVGSGGAGAASGVKGSDGSNSVFGSISAFGGGAGGGTPAGTSSNGNSGGSGGGSADSGSPIGIGGQGTAGQGNKGGNAATTGASGGGGGAGTPGLNGVSSTICGNGGAGVASDISGTRTTYAGGGGGGPYSTNTAGIGGAGGGGNGGTSGTNSAGQSGSANTGGGAGGSAYNNAHVTGANGGSGVVIVSYPGTTQWFTGGTLSYGNGNIVHSFYSSGTLAPTTPSTYVDTGYQISRSLRFNSADSAYLNRTPASATNRKTWTWSGWVKVSGLNINQYGLFTSRSGTDSTRFASGLVNDNTFTISNIDASNSTNLSLTTTQVFRDPSAWYHFVIALDTTQAVNTERIKFYVNGNRVTAFASSPTYPSQNADLGINATIEHNIGKYALTGNFIDGYMTEVNFIDGQALTPQSFGYYNPDTGVWSPLKFVGTYGTNGFYLNFSDNSNTTAATLGKDYSGNGNNWTPNNFSVAAGAGNDSLVDSPTAYGTDTGAGGTVRGNYCTWNSALPAFSGIVSLSNGNLDATTSTGATTGQNTYGTYSLSSGKWYWEATFTQSGSSSFDSSVGWATAANDSTSTFYGYLRNGQKVSLGTTSSYGASYTSGDVIGIALDLDAGTMTFYKNGVSQGTAFTGLSGSLIPTARMIRESSYTSAWTANFGQRPFAYTAPSGFLALCTQNLPTPTIGATTATQAGQYFNPVLYTGDRTSRTIDVGFQPDWVWVKSRNAADDHYLMNAVVGTGKYLVSNSTAAEVTNAASLTAFTSNGFSIGNTGTTNETGRTYVAWNWRANGAGSSNTAGSITSTVSANTTSGFSIVTYTGNATANQTIGHGLGARVDFAIIKSRSAVTSPAWMVWHRSVCSGNGKALALEETNALQGPFVTPMWDSSNTSTQSSTTTFTIGANGTINASGATYVAYCFAEVPGYSRFGSYTGNGSTDGPFVFCGFRPALVIAKNVSNAGSWIVLDSARDPYNIASATLNWNSSGAESPFNSLDIVSNGFKMRNTNSGFNTNGDTYIFIAFASNPFKYALAR